MQHVTDDEKDEYVEIGPEPFLERFAQEYEIPMATLRESARFRAAEWSIGSESFNRTYLVPESLLRPHGDFPCAGDAEALKFCDAIADELVSRFGKTRDGAVEAINRLWSGAGSNGRKPRVWIVGADFTYHDVADRWAERIYDEFG